MKGFTLIELLIAFAVIGLVLLVVSGAVPEGASQVSFGINGLTETRCIGGYQFVIGEGGQARQIMDELGKGVRCSH